MVGIALAIFFGTLISVVLLIVAGIALKRLYDWTVRKAKKNQDIAAFFYGLLLGFVIALFF